MTNWPAIATIILLVIIIFDGFREIGRWRARIWASLESEEIDREIGDVDLAKNPPTMTWFD